MGGEPIEISGTKIEVGQREMVRIPVGRLPSNNLIQIRAYVFRALRPGPVLLVLGGVHGDEINGVEIVRQALTDGLFDELQRGAVIAIPVLNLYGFINFSRDLHDGKDVNRSFPGSRRGSLASRVAHTLTQEVLPYVDLGVDFHTGGNGLYNFPQLRFTGDDLISEKLAWVFGAPCLLAKRSIPKSLRRVAGRKGKTMLVFEGGENLRYDSFSVAKALEGLQRLMYAQGMVAKPGPEARPRLFRRSTWMRAPRAGMFRWTKDSGQRVHKGEPIGSIGDPYGNNQQTIYARRDGFIIGHRNSPVVSQGDALFHLGYGEEA